MEDFYKQALKTENLDFDGIKDRADKNKDFSRLLLYTVMNGDVLDGYKKSIFYGKENRSHTLSKEEENCLDHAKSPSDNYKPTEDIIRLEHAIVGIITEATELACALAKHKYLGEDLDWVNIGEECGDLNWYESIMDDLLKKNTDGGMDHWNQRVIDKLKARHGDSFNGEKVMERDLAKERETLEERSEDELV